MSEPLFNIIFFGILQPGKDKAVVMQNMAKLFKTEADKLAPFFAGGRKVIKSNVDELVAEKYRVTLENIGLVIKIEAATPAQTVATQPAAQAVAGADTGGITMAEAGANVIANPVAVTPQKIADISAITMAEPGANVIENPIAVTPREIGDISHLSMAEAGANVIENPVAVKPQEIGDISALSMAEPGADIIVNPKQKENAPIPDISELSLE